MTRIRILSLTLALAMPLLSSDMGAQQGARVTIVVSSAGKALPDAIVRENSVGGRTDSTGTVALELASGRHTLEAAKLGYAPGSISFSVMAGIDTTVAIGLTERAHTTAPVIVTAARTEQRIEEVPLRVEVLAGEDVDEKTSMRPGDLTQMVAEIPGVRVQPGAPGIGGANLRVQGFRGQYTEFLTDGLPLTGASEAGLSLVQLPPLDLAQIEVIKGASSALYGPSALGGVVNFVTRRPPAEGEARIRDAVLSSSSFGGLDGVGFAGDRLNDSWSYTMLAGAHRQPIREADTDGWADVVGSTRAELRPRLFWNGNRGNKLLVTAGASADDRNGGEIPSASPSTIQADKLDARHADIGAVGRFALTSGTLLNVRTSISGQARDHRFPTGASESDRATSSLAEVSATRSIQRVILVGGIAARADSYSNRNVSGFDYSFTTLSGFVQTTVTATDAISLSLTGRCDRHNLYGTSCVPVAGLLVRQPAGFSERLSAGLGSYAPTPFIDETGAIGFSRLRPFPGSLAPALAYEKARNFAVDLGYHFGGLDVNATGYASTILHPVILHELTTGPYAGELVNAPGAAHTRGIDVFAVFTGDPVSVTAFYSILEARETVLPDGANTPAFEREIPYNPSRRAGLDIAVDAEETGTRAAIESYYTGRQHTEADPYRSTTPAFTTVEFLITQNVRKQQLFVSVDNLTNVRQTNYGPLLLPAPSRPGRVTTELWAPLEGRTLRAGVRARF
ncbi:MAG: TonB-dependent receptor plug domain-containing protein [Gemmatimonadaceae bacterium]